MRQITCPSFVLSRESFGESDLIVTLFTKGHGKIKGIAKGAKKSKKRFMNALEPFSFVKISMRQKGDNSLFFLENSLTIQPFQRIRSDYLSFLMASLVLELTDMWFKEGEKDDKIFDLLKWYLLSLEDGQDPFILTLAYKVRLLSAVGLLPVLKRCKFCGKEPKDPSVSYSLGSGQIICLSCCENRNGNIIHLSSIKSLSYLTNCEPSRIFRLKITNSNKRELWSYLKRRHSFCLEEEPRSYRLIESLKDRLF